MKQVVYQIYCDTELGVNKWLIKNNKLEILDFKMSTNEDGEIIMVIYKVKKELTKNV